MTNNFWPLNIQHFAEGGATGEGAEVGHPQSGENQVVYGKQSEENAQTGVKPSTPEGKNGASEKNNAEPSFKELIEGKHKGDFENAVQHIIGKRLAQERAKTQKAVDVSQKLMARYGVNSIEDLNKVLDSDGMFESMAAEKGENPETLRELENLRLIANKYNDITRISEAEKRANEQIESWQNEANELRKIYPDFNLATELENPQFKSLISTKNPQYQISMQEAYKLVHMDEFIKAAEADAASKIAKSVNARTERPSENGLGNQSGVTIKDDVTKLSKKDRADIAKRAARGEKIEF